MSNIDSLHERGSALENQFFSELDAKLLEELKVKQDHDNSIAEFSRISGIKDAAILESIYKLGVTGASFAALRVFPMAAVAWGDGTLDDAEKLTVSTIASSHFPVKQSPAGHLLQQWLETKPSAALFDAWESYAKAMVASLPTPEAESLKNSIVNEINAVATTSGGLLGWAAISTGEHKVMNRIVAALTQA